MKQMKCEATHDDRDRSAAADEIQPPSRRELTVETLVPVPDHSPQSTHLLPGRRVLNLLRGHWGIERRIEPGGHFNGEAAFTQRSADRLLYCEHGRLILDDGTALEGRRSYVYALRNGDIEISFADGAGKGRHFLNIYLLEDRPAALPIVSVDRHLCRLDTYDATFRLEDPGVFKVVYVVNGPANAYISRSTYRRLKGSELAY